MSDELNWDEVLGSVEKDEADSPSSPSGEFEALPKGPYEVVVQDADKQVASTGKDMIKVRVQVTGGPYANRVLFNYIVFAKENPKAMRLTLDRLAAFGLTREFFATARPSISQIAELLVGRKAIAVVGIQDSGEYKGRNEVKSFRLLDDGSQSTPVLSAATKPGIPTIPTAPVVTQPLVAVTASAEAPDPFEG